MFNIDFTFLFTAINLGIIYFFVKKFLFGRLGGFMDERAASIAADIEKGERLIKEGEEMRRRQEEILAEAYDERRKIIDEAKLSASAEYDAIIADAKKDAARIILEARETGSRERAALHKELRQSIASLAVSAASKIIEANMDDERTRKLADDFIAAKLREDAA
jgi:F-type H+-transporting ATPase subunit b